MLEGCSSGQIQRRRDFLDQWPGIEGIQEVDVTGDTAQNLNWQFVSVCNECLGRLLVWITTIAQWKLCNVLRVLLSEEVGDHGVVLSGVLECL